MSDIKVKLSCKDCGRKGIIPLSITEATDWGYIILDEIKELGFELSETSIYCEHCVRKYKRGLFGLPTDFLR